jgi:translation initiation factor 2B subunit (eIF-2B alpha/beta/delta family)
MSTSDTEWISEQVKPIVEDLQSGAAELALRAIVVFQTIMSKKADSTPDEVRTLLQQAAKQLVGGQPAMAPLFHLCNKVLISIDDAKTTAELTEKCQKTLDDYERMLCDSVAKIADAAYELIEPGALVFAYSFSSTVVSMLLNARSKGRYFRVACTEARPSMEGRKLAARLAAGGIEVIHTFDNAMGLILPNCTAAFMGCDCIARPGVVNKVGSWMLAVACRELKVPLYALSGSEKFVGDERLFEFESHDRPGEEVWDEAPKGVRILNHQFDLVPFDLLSGLVTESGVLKEADVEQYLKTYDVHDVLKLEPVAF